MASDPAKFVREDDRLLEKSTVRPVDQSYAKLRHESDLYGSNKLHIEEYLAEQPGLLWTGLRLPDVLGPFDRSGRQTGLLQKLARGDPIGTLISPREGPGSNPGWYDGDGNTHRVGNVYSIDVARACICVLTAGSRVGGVGLNIASAEAPTWVEFVQLVGSELAKHVPAEVAKKIQAGICFVRQPALGPSSSPERWVNSQNKLCAGVCACV
jgi:nucleoside-diphosphate-sugar epimerase